MLNRTKFAVIGLALFGCSTQRFYVPLAGKAHASEAITCAKRCQATRAGDALRDCMLTCPGTRVLDGSCGATERPPHAICVERSTVNTIAIAIVAGVLLVGAATAVAFATSPR